MVRMDRESRVIEIDGGRRIGVGVYGAVEGVPVVALHGTPASRFMFSVADDAASRLGLTLYCIERAGYGLSDPPQDLGAGDYLSHATDDLVQAIDALGLEQFAVLGISGGGPFAVSLASRLGDRVRALVLVSPMGPILELPSDRSAQLSFKHRVLFRASLKFPRPLRVGALGFAAAFRAAPVTFARIFAWSLGPADRFVLSKAFARKNLIEMTHEAVSNGVMGALADLDAFSRAWGVDFKAVRSPVSLWLGTHDRLVPVASTRWLAELLPNCEIVELEGQGHFWVYEKADDVLRDVLRLMHGAGHDD